MYTKSLKKQKKEMKKIWAINQSVLAILLTEAFVLIFDSVQKQHEFFLEDHTINKNSLTIITLLATHFSPCRKQHITFTTFG